MSQTPLTPTSYTEKFRHYFDQPVAEKAASTLANGIQIELSVAGETFTFTRKGGKNQLLNGSAADPELIFTMTPGAADEILAETSEEIGTVGVKILKLVISSDANRRVAVKFKAGFLKLWSKGYFGVLKSGGSQFAAQLSALGLSGMDAIKAALGKLKG